jgi:hypothetical protein
MRNHRILEPDAWYDVRIRINNNEPLFLPDRGWGVNLFKQVFREAREIYDFQLRGLQFNGESAAWLP